MGFGFTLLTLHYFFEALEMSIIIYNGLDSRFSVNGVFGKIVMDFCVKTFNFGILRYIYISKYISVYTVFLSIYRVYHETCQLVNRFECLKGSDRQSEVVELSMQYCAQIL